MTPLREKMIEAMRVRGFAVRTHQSYLSAVSKLAGYYGRQLLPSLKIRTKPTSTSAIAI